MTSFASFPSLIDRTVLITGGASGIGACLVERFASQGAKVGFIDTDQDAGRALQRVLADGRYCPEFVVADLSDMNALADAVEVIRQRFGAIGILVNNAAVFDMGPIEDITEASYDRVFAVNVKGMLFTLQAAAKCMIARGQGGKIINFASQAGRRGEALVAVYCASKAAVISLTQSAGLALIKHRINVNGIAPGVVDTPMWDEVDALFARYENRPLGEKKRLVGEGVPFGRMAQPDDHVGCAIFLASPESNYVVAQTFNVDGGQWMS